MCCGEPGSRPVDPRQLRVGVDACRSAAVQHHRRLDVDAGQAAELDCRLRLGPPHRSPRRAGVPTAEPLSRPKADVSRAFAAGVVQRGGSNVGIGVQRSQRLARQRRHWSISATRRWFSPTALHQVSSCSAWLPRRVSDLPGGVHRARYQHRHRRRVHHYDAQLRAERQKLLSHASRLDIQPAAYRQPPVRIADAGRRTPRSSLSRSPTGIGLLIR